MTNQEHLEHLLKARHAGIAIESDEEVYALGLVRQAVMALPHQLRIWSILDGLREGLIEKAKPAADTENPAAALYAMARVEEPFIAVFLDLVSHLEDGRTRRALRELLIHAERLGSTVILIDATAHLPVEIRAHMTRYTPALPMAAEIGEIIRQTVKSLHRENPIEATLARADFDAVVRNLQGLSRSQVRRVILDVIMEDDCLDEADVAGVLSRKRHIMSSEWPTPQKLIHSL